MTDDRRDDRRPVGGSAPPAAAPAPGGPRGNLPPGWSPVPPSGRGGPGGPNGRPPQNPPQSSPPSSPPNGRGAPGPAPTRVGPTPGAEPRRPAVGNGQPGPNATRVGGPFPDPHGPGGESRREPRLLTHDGSRPLATAGVGTTARTGAGSRPGTAPTAATDVVQGTAAPGRGGVRTPPPGTPPPGRGDDEGTPDPKRRGRRIRRVIYVLVALLVLGPVLAFAVGWIFFRIPSPDDATNNQIATIAYADGSSLASLSQAEGNRIKVPLSQVPLAVQHAVVSAEDRSFYTNYGFDPIGIARAAWNQARGGVGGGSTITQQYVKNVLVGDEYSLSRKYREVVIAAKINQEQSKEQILENYLNTIYFGRGAYGIQAAAQAYFGRPVETLSPSEGAMIAGLIQAPSKWDPAVDRGGSQQRWNYVLDGMVDQNWLSRADRQAAVFPTTIPSQQRRSGIPDNDRGHIVSAVKDELASYGITEQQVNQEGLKVETTIDPKLQQQAADAAERTLQGQPANLRTALVSVDPRTGSIVAYYGGEQGSGFDYAQAKRQPGSSFKPFVLLAGLERNPPIGLGNTYDGSSPQTIAGTKIANSEGESCPNCNLKEAMTLSINTIFYRLGVDVGPQKVADAAHQAGISAPLDGATGGISIGDKEVEPGDMASAYATFAADGQYHRPHMVTRVTTADGRVLYDGGVPAPEQRMSQQLARNVTESMLDVASHSQIPLAAGRPVASKTGTVQSSVEGQNNDAWTVGYTPQISTAVWVGTDDNSPIKSSNGRPIYGRGVPGQIWQRFMNSALRNEPVEQFSDFKAIGTPIAPPKPPEGQDPNNPDGQQNGQYCVDGVCVDYGNGQNGNNGQNNGGDGNNGGGNNGENGNNGGGGDGNNGDNGGNRGNGDGGGQGGNPDNGGGTLFPNGF